MKTQKLLGYLRKCIQKYDLIQEDDHIAVGVSGGKDSLLLLYALSELSRFYPKHFTVMGITVDVGFHMDFTPVIEFCREINVPFQIVETQIADVIFKERKEDHPCSLCSNMRRGALVNAAIENGCNKLALGHHKDDFLTTFLLSLIYDGQMYTFSPKTNYPDREIQVIRPLLYVPEGAVVTFVEENRFPVVKNLCPEDHVTKRQEMADLLADLKKKYPDIKDRMLHAIENSDIQDWKELR